MQFYNISIYVSILSILIPLSIYATHRARFPAQNRIVGLFLSVSLFSDSIAFACLKWDISPVPVNNVFDSCSFIILSVFYYNLFFNTKAKLLFVMGSVIYGTALTYFIWSLGFTSPHTTLWSINGLIVGLYGLLYFIMLPGMTLQRLLDKNLYSHTIINGSFLFYFVITILIFVFADYFSQTADLDTKGLFWSFHNIANTLKNIGLAIGLYYTGRRDVKTTLIEIEKIGREKSGKLHDDIWAKSLRR